MVLNYPSYLGKKSEIIQGTGNAVVPEGTLVNWRINALATNKISFKSNNQISTFSVKENTFSLSKNELWHLFDVLRYGATQFFFLLIF